MSKKTITSIYIDLDDLAYLDELGKKQNRSRSYYLQQALKEYIAVQKNKSLMQWDKL